MTASPDHDWTQDLRRSFAYIEKAVAKQNVLVIAYLIISVFISLLKHFGAGFPTLLANIVSLVLVLFIGAAVIREVFFAENESDGDQSARWKQSGTPILSLLLLLVIFWIPGFVLSLMLIVPGVWWAAMGCLAVVAVVLEDLGAVAAIKRSHKLVAGHLMEVILFMLPAAIVFLAANPAFGRLSEYGLQYLAEQGYQPLVTLAAVLITGLLFAAIWLMSNLLIFAYLAQLFIRLIGKQQTPPVA